MTEPPKTPPEPSPIAAPPQGNSPEPSEDSSGLRSLVTYSLLTSLCALIPVPFLDDWAIQLLRRRAVLHAGRKWNVHLTDLEVEHLARGDNSFEFNGCLKGCFLGALMRTGFYVVKKLFRKVFRTLLFFLTVRDMLKQFSRTFHENYLLRHALRLGVLPTGQPSNYALPSGEDPRAVVRSLRQAIETAFKSLDHGPLTKVARATFAGSRGVLRHAARTLIRPLRALRRGQASEDVVERELRQHGEEELGGLIDSLTREIAKETEYLGRQEATLEKALGLTDPASEKAT